jgi:hypothetical protein
LSKIASIFGKQEYRPPEASKELALPLAKVGVEIEVENSPFRNNNSEYVKHFPEWKAHLEHPEGSLRNAGMEFSTKGGYVGGELVSAIRDFCEEAKKVGFSEGYPRAAIHFHIDVTELSASQLLNTILCYMMFENSFFSFAGEWRRTCGFCDGLLTSQDEYPEMAALLYDMENFDIKKLQDRDNTFSKYMAVNLKPLYEQGTIEFRHLPTTFNFERIMQALNMALCMKRFGKEVDTDPVAYLQRYGPSAMVRKVFKGFDWIDNYIVYKDMFEAVPDIMALRLLRRKGKLDPWDPPDNPLLDGKRKAPVEKKEIVKKGKTVDTVFDGVPASMSVGRRLPATTLSVVEDEVLNRWREVVVGAERDQ